MRLWCCMTRANARWSRSTAAALRRRAPRRTTTATEVTSRCRSTAWPPAGSPGGSLEWEHACSVSGVVAVYEALWRRYGTLDWPELWEPAIRLADEGVAITKYIS